MRRRMLSPEFFTDPDVVAMDAFGRLFYQGLWCVADDSGCFELNLLYLKMKIFPGDSITNETLQGYITSLTLSHKLIHYQTSGKKYAWIKNFHKHQRLDNPSPPTVPLPNWMVWHGQAEFGSHRHKWHYEVISYPETQNEDQEATKESRASLITLPVGDLSKTGLRQVSDVSPLEVKLSKVKLSEVNIHTCAPDGACVQPMPEHIDVKMDESLAVKKAAGAGKKSASRSITLSSAQSTQFDRFWFAYPKRKSKGDAEKAWNKLQPDDHLVDVILSAIEQAKESKEWQRDGGKYIPHPASWLNRKCWKDEYKNDYLTKGVGKNGGKSKYDLPEDFYWTDSE